MKPWQIALAGALALALLSGKRRGRRKGIYWDIGESKTRGDVATYLERLKRAGMTDVGIMVNHQDDFEDGRFDWEIWTPGGVLWFADVLRRNGIDVHLVYWPAPDRSYLDGLLYGRPGQPSLPEIATRARARSTQADAEGFNWDDDRVRGFGDLDDAAAYLAAGLRARTPATMQHGVSAHSGRLQDELAERLDYHATQVYSHYNDGDPDYRFDPRPFFRGGSPDPRNETGKWGPGNRAIYGYRKAVEAGAPRVVLAHSAWDQSNYSDPVAAMLRAVEVSRWLGVDENWWWSAKWAFGDRMTSYSPRALALA